MGDGTDWSVLGAAWAVKGLFTGESNPKPGGLVGDGEFVLTSKRAARCFRLTTEVGVFGVRGSPNALVALLCLGGTECEWEWSVCIAVAGFVRRGNLIPLN